MPLTALRQVRKMRGGAQAHLVETDDGQCYVVKFRNNPQHRRVLINEVLAAGLLDYLKIAAPKTALIHITGEFLAANPEVHLTVGTRKVPVEPGWHFGSRYPGDPARLAVYDFLPDALLAQVANLDDFRAVLVFDKWIGNADGRQSVFFRAMVQAEEGPRRAAFVASMIDHGFAFNGPCWDYPDAPLHGLYHRPLVYEQVTGLEGFQPWLDQVVNFPEEVVDQAYKRVPLQWLDGEDRALEDLLEKLLDRRQRVPDLIESCRRARPALFPNWR